MLKEWLTPKAVLIILITIILAVVASKGLKYVNGLVQDKNRLYTELVGQKEAYKQLSDNAAALAINYKKETDLRQEAEAKFADEKSALLGQIKILSDATFLIKEKARTENNSDVVFDGPNSSYVLNELKFDPPAGSNESGPAIGYVLIFKDGRVVSKVYDHQIKVNTVVSKDETTGRYSIISKADYVLKSPSLNQSGTSWVNRPYPLKIVGGTADIDPTEPVILKRHFELWDPKLNVNLNADLNGLYPGAGVSIMGYGVDKNDLDFKFLQFGVQVVNKYGFEPTFTPVLWRPFDGFIDNTYVGPGVSYGDGHAKYFLGIQVGL